MDILRLDCVISANFIWQLFIITYFERLNYIRVTDWRGSRSLYVEQFLAVRCETPCISAHALTEINGHKLLKLSEE